MCVGEGDEDVVAVVAVIGLGAVTTRFKNPLHEKRYES